MSWGAVAVRVLVTGPLAAIIVGAPASAPATGPPPHAASAEPGGPGARPPGRERSTLGDGPGERRGAPKPPADEPAAESHRPAPPPDRTPPVGAPEATAAAAPSAPGAAPAAEDPSPQASPTPPAPSAAPALGGEPGERGASIGQRAPGAAERRSRGRERAAPRSGRPRRGASAAGDGSARRPGPDAGTAAPDGSGSRPAGERRRGARPAGAERDDGAGPAERVTGTVTRIVEVVPAAVRAALAGLTLIALAALGAAAAVALRAGRLQRQRRRLAADVGLLQSALLPEVAPRVGGAVVSAAYRPAEGLAAGGDFYDAFELAGGRTCVVVGDVAGHGREAVPLTALVRYTLRAYLEAGLGPGAALQATGAVLESQLAGRLTTAVAAVFDPLPGTLAYATAGHPPPLLLGGGFRPIVAGASPPLGTGAPTGRRQTTVPVPVGSAVCLYTDGLFDARAGGAPLGYPRLVALLADESPQRSAADVLRLVVDRTDAQPDDMVAVVVRPARAPLAAAPARVEILEVDLPTLERGRADRFVRACGVDPAVAQEVVAEAHLVARRAGAALLSVHGLPDHPLAIVHPVPVPDLPAVRAARSRGGVVRPGDAAPLSG